MIPTYLIGSTILFGIWLILYIYRRDVRREMVVMSVLVATSGLMMEAFVWTRDWWRPSTITGTLIGIEDLLMGFSMGGITAVLYEELFSVKLAQARRTMRHHTAELLTIIGLSIALGIIGFYLLELRSWIVWLIATLLPLSIIYLRRPDLIIPSLISGVLLLGLAIPVFLLLHALEPTIFVTWWLNEYLTGITFLRIPIEDLLWFLTAGMFLSPLYEFWRGTRLVKIKENA